MRTLPDPKLAWPISLDAVALIAEAEGLRLKAYRCPSGIPTIGWGHTGPEVVIGKMVITKEQADQLLLDDINEKIADVRARCTVPPTENQLGALTSFAFNCRNWETSTVLKAHNKEDFASAARAFALWNKGRVNGELTVMPGLTARRAAEAALYLRADPDGPAPEMPQAVEPESKLSASPINRGGIAVAGAGVLSVLSEAGDSLGGLAKPLGAAKAFLVDVMGIHPTWIPYLIMIAAGGAIVYWRTRQRREGWT